jgi:hypothetical protein
MGGKAQDYTLKPANQLGMSFTGYSTPINQYLNAVQQPVGNNQVNYGDQVKLIADHPQINDVIGKLYSVDPNLMIFNSMNQKYSGGTPQSVMANNFASTVLKPFASDIDKYGEQKATQNLIDRQMDLVSMMPDAKGQMGNFNQSTMSNPTYRALNALKDSYTPVIPDAQWSKQVTLGAPAGSTFSDTYRDPTTGKGVGLILDQAGKPTGVRFISQDGTDNRVYNGQDPLNTMFKNNIPANAIAGLVAKVGDVDVGNGFRLSQLANGDFAKNTASDSWLQNTIANAKRDYQDQIRQGFHPAIETLNSQIDKYTNQNNIAKAFLASFVK